MSNRDKLLMQLLSEAQGYKEEQFIISFYQFIVETIRETITDEMQKQIQQIKVSIETSLNGKVVDNSNIKDSIIKMVKENIIGL